jgi:hypothetical protein
VPLPTHRGYELELPALPVIAETEACAEKLARYRRIAVQRDLYHLSRFAQRPINEPAVRRLWVLKVWHDVIDDRRGNRPLDPADILTPKTAQDFAPDSLGSSPTPSTSPDGNDRYGSDSASSPTSTTTKNGGRNAIPGTAAKSTPRSPQAASPATRSRPVPHQFAVDPDW